MRAKGYTSGDRVVFLLADLFHNVPLQFDRLDRGEITVQDIVQELETRARQHGIEGWLDLRLGEIAKCHPDEVAPDDTSM